jgi:butyryl-CoA dehydrogenase
MIERPDLEFPERFDLEEFENVCNRLSTKSVELDKQFLWPAEQLNELKKTAVQSWLIPKEFGGLEFSSLQMTWGYTRLAMGCLTTTFVLTQQNGACQRIIQSDNTDLKSRLLPLYARGERTATVGISHLTTSRQHLKTPIVSAERAEGGYVYNGFVPWVTGACCVDDILIGATLPDGQQMLAIVSTNLKGVEPEKPVSMLALNSSMTGPVKLNQVFIPDENVVAGPVENVMKVTSGGPGSLTTSALALGVAAGCISNIEKESLKRDDLVPIHENLKEGFDAIFEDMLSLLQDGQEIRTGLNAESVRQEANSLVLRSSQAYLAASKGAGYISGHPAEKSVREAMFFLVWSCPQPVLNAALREFACLID